MSNKIAYIVFGASGDLSKRYLLPALKNIQVDVIPISRGDYDNLKKIIPAEGEKIFHLAIPAEAVAGVVTIIAKNFGNKNVKILLEKPFGQDLKSAQDLIHHIEKFFREDQIYRVDHYLGKSSAQRITTEDWPRENIREIEIIGSEKIGIEGRVKFYEQTGALRDMVQSHLLSLAALALSKKNRGLMPSERHLALRELEVVCDITKHECVKRGQYEGYREEVDNPLSVTETFVEVNMVSNAERWRGVKIRIATGKALREKRTEVKIVYGDGRNLVLSVEREPDAYEKVIRAACAGNQGLFMSGGEVLEGWRILNAIQETWKNGVEDLIFYNKGADIDEI